MIIDLVSSIPIYVINVLVSRFPLEGGQNLLWASQFTETIRMFISWGAIFLNSTTDVIILLSGFSILPVIMISALILKAVITIYNRIKPWPL